MVFGCVFVSREDVVEELRDQDCVEDRKLLSSRIVMQGYLLPVEKR